MQNLLIRKFERDPQKFTRDKSTAPDLYAGKDNIWNSYLISDESSVSLLINYDAVEHNNKMIIYADSQASRQAVLESARSWYIA